ASIFFGDVLNRFLLLLLMIPLVAFAQEQRVVNGTVSDAGGPLPGVTVTVKETKEATYTDDNGNSTIDASNGKTLVFTVIGYSTQEVPIGSQSTIKVLMESETSDLNEVVVIGYGTQQRRDITGSISNVDATALKDLPVG